MKKFIVLTLATSLLIGGISLGDIQSPPGGKQTPIRKLSRAVGISYSVSMKYQVLGQELLILKAPFMQQVQD